MLNRELSAGGVIFRREAEKLLFLIIYSARNKIWGFPKGHIEPDETEQEAALREITEETGLQDLKIIAGFREEDVYEALSNRGQFKGQKIEKHSVYFLMETLKKSVVVDKDEISAFKWLKVNAAIAMLDFDGAKLILEKSNDFLCDVCSEENEIEEEDKDEIAKIDDDIQDLEMLDFFDDEFF